MRPGYLMAGLSARRRFGECRGGGKIPGGIVFHDVFCFEGCGGSSGAGIAVQRPAEGVDCEIKGLVGGARTTGSRSGGGV
jgi:hypothetical protein